MTDEKNEPAPSGLIMMDSVTDLETNSENYSDKINDKNGEDPR